ncbi:MAG: 16S rRNA (guanine(966)-N(2))-methyltransferase RsmD [Gammaproteobacteria bacterium]|nr:16S rRNA (guanine(966)-N(2))-methyltransferase RsmD [Gammaproteobacteria bacterium]MBU1656293.1 16S rRNA (guanine(966)-N(2))-methyltransferase RsmD [Gammaproteobacteria bacterium]MBU1959858.1 16S rRNA (guanine(966)-N(2))-methyltransferase RsmD [Gammaproteobacteria bacterium]
MGRRPGVTNRVRIIGGTHRGRLLSFPDAAGLRPTAGRVRETLFNWLQPFIPGSRCLDLFAGSGAIGFEAASRGAGRVVMTERDPKVAARLKENARELGLANVEVVTGDALIWLASCKEAFDLVFIDPPFADGLLKPALQGLARTDLLLEGARIYLETEAGKPFPPLPPGLVPLREKVAGQVRYGLVQFQSFLSQ